MLYLNRNSITIQENLTQIDDLTKIIEISKKRMMIVDEQNNKDAAK